MDVATFVPWIISSLALIVAITAAVSARRSANAATANAAIAARAEQRTLAEREDKDGPTFEAEPVTVHDRQAEIKLRMIGGPGDTAVEVRAAGAPFLLGLTGGAGVEPAEMVWFPPSEPGATLALTAHLTVDVSPTWEHDGYPLALLCDVQSREEPPRRWERRVSVLLMAPPPPPRIY